MSIGHMPKPYQYAFGVLWLASVALAGGLFAVAPLDNALSPFPALIVLAFAVAIAHAAWRALVGEDSDAGERQARLTEYT